MDCKLILQVSNYNKETNKKDDIPVPLGTISKEQEVSLEAVAKALAALTLEQRQELAGQLKAARVQKVTEKMVQDHQMMSNISLKDLIHQYPDLEKYGIPEDLSYKCTLIRCYRAEFNGHTYKGRALDADGNEVFIINSFWDAEKLFKHLSIKLNLQKFIKGNDVDPSLEKFQEKLQILSKHYHKTVQQLIEDFLIDKNEFNTFKQGDKIYSPKRIINEVLSQIVGQTYDVGDKSDLQLELETIKEYSKSNNEWKFEKKALYKVLSTFFENFSKTYSFEQFSDLDTDTLNTLLRDLFKDDIKLLKATVKTSTKGERIIQEAPKEKIRKNLTQQQIQQIYQNTLYAADSSLPKSYKTAAKKLQDSFKQALKNVKVTWTDSGVDYEVFINVDDEYNVTAWYEKEQEAVVKEKSSYITLDMHNWTSIGEIYDFGYNTESIFKHEETYKGFYIYKYYKNGVNHYAVSRSVISPKAYMKTFSSLERAKTFINENTDTIKSCGLWSIKQKVGRPRISELEMSGLREGQIITTLDLQLKSREYKNFSDPVKSLFDGTVQNFHDRLGFITDIKTLDTPEKAAAFIFLVHDQLKGKDFFEAIASQPESVQKIINDINNSKTISYIIEKSKKYGTRTEYYLKVLQNNGTNITLDGNFGENTVHNYMSQNLTNMITYFNNTLGIQAEGLEKSELEQFSKDNGLNLEHKLDSVKAFVFNGKIYINTSIASAEDLFHELSHILLGAIKVQKREMYDEIINYYMKQSSFKYQYNLHKKTYKHYAEQDIIEETIADLIAEEMFKMKQLGTSEVNGNELIDKFNDIFQRSNQFKKIQDNGLGFSRYFKKILDEDTQNQMQRNMRISELIRQKIQDNIIQEDCKT